MVTISFSPLVHAVVDAWRARLPMSAGGGPLQVGESDLRELIHQLCRAIDVLTEAVDTEAVLARLRSETPQQKRQRSE